VSEVRRAEGAGVAGRRAGDRGADDLAGNAWEGEYHDSCGAAPDDGSAWRSGGGFEVLREVGFVDDAYALQASGCPGRETRGFDAYSGARCA